MYITMTSSVKLEWMKFSKWKDVIDTDDYGFPCVYIVADSDGTPLYIGATTQKKRKVKGNLLAGGLRARYFHDWTVLDACMEGTRRSVYIAKVRKDQAFKIEHQLIFENKPKYNKNQKEKPPKIMFKITHKGRSRDLNIVNRDL